jgi:ribosome-associated protein
MKVTVKKKDNAQPLHIHTEFIKLDAALKLANVIESGGMAKTVIQDEQVKVNGEICTMRGKKLYPGDKFSFAGETFIICGNEA